MMTMMTMMTSNETKWNETRSSLFTLHCNRSRHRRPYHVNNPKDNDFGVISKPGI